MRIATCHKRRAIYLSSSISEVFLQVYQFEELVTYFPNLKLSTINLSFSISLMLTVPTE